MTSKYVPWPTPEQRYRLKTRLEERHYVDVIDTANNNKIVLSNITKALGAALAQKYNSGEQNPYLTYYLDPFTGEWEQTVTIDVQTQQNLVMFLRETT